MRIARALVFRNVHRKALQVHMNIVIIGPKGAGKSTVGDALAERLGLDVIETDRLMEKIFAAGDGEELSYRDIYKKIGEDPFRDLERDAVEEACRAGWKIIVTGGGTFMSAENRRLLRKDGLIVYLSADSETLWQRATEHGIPATFSGPNPQAHFEEQVTFREEVMLPFADIVVDTSSGAPTDLADEVAQGITQELAVRQQAANTYGDIIRLTTFGESHGTAIGCILDGVAPGVDVSEEAIRIQMERRRPGQSKVVTQRNEPDKVEILSGVFEGKSTGAPIGMIIYNRDQDSTKYDDIKNFFRPGHADFTFYKKYGHRDHRGGGRSSARETALRVATGAIAMDILAGHGVTFRAYAVEIAGIKAETCDYDVIESNPVRCADPAAAKAMEEAILAARKDRDSVGGIIQLDILGVPVGLGDPVFGKLDARLSYALMTIGAFKGVEVGDGFALTKLQGSESNDNMADGDFLSNHGGGITGGISTGQTIVLRLAVKPTASIAKSQRTIDLEGKNTDISVHGRHDPCVVPRAVPVIENMAALTILDAWEVQKKDSARMARVNEFSVTER